MYLDETNFQLHTDNQVNNRKFASLCLPKYSTNPLQKLLKVVSFQLTIPPKCFGVPTTLAPIVMESPERQKPIFLDLKERPTEAPFGA